MSPRPLLFTFRSAAGIPMCAVLDPSTDGGPAVIFHDMQQIGPARPFGDPVGDLTVELLRELYDPRAPLRLELRHHAYDVLAPNLLELLAFFGIEP
jgi:hypothetical protein